MKVNYYCLFGIVSILWFTEIKSQNINRESKDKIKTTTETTYNYNYEEDHKYHINQFKEVIKSNVSHYRYDKDGNLQEFDFTNYYTKKEAERLYRKYWRHYRIDDKGNVEESDSLKISFINDSVGNLTEKRIISLYSNTLIEQSVYTYGIHGKLIEKSGNRIYGGEVSGAPQSKQTYYKYKYDSKEKLIEMQESYESANDGHFYNVKIHKYDTIGNEIEMVYIPCSSCNENKFVYMYDNNHHCIKELSYSLFDKEPLISVYYYDQFGNRIEEDYIMKYGPNKGKGQPHYKWKYIEKDKPTEYLEMGSSGSESWIMHKTIFKYDDKGNEIERLNYRGSYELRSICETKIEYYE
ncbi:MAG: hypothetical protein NTU51_00815 [Bacteroidetes bacterium]|nr:hypothetical protein [Bacteroidota bacterium]